MRQLTAADLSATKARHRVRTYELAAAAGIAPTTLYALLNERLPLDDGRAAQIAAAIQRLGGQVRTR